MSEKVNIFCFGQFVNMRSVQTKGLQRAGLYAGWAIAFRPPTQPLPIEIMMLNLSTKAQTCWTSPEPQPGFAIS